MTDKSETAQSGSRLPAPGSRAYLSLGANLGDRSGTLTHALELLVHGGRVRVARRSSLYETEPIGMVDQPWFLNLVVEVATDLPPEDLLDVAQGVERALGRTREIRRGPRTVDIDILLYDDRVISSPRLTIPHPEMTHRRFVLQPLLEIAPDLRLPDGRRVAELLAGLQGQAVRRLDPS